MDLIDDVANEDSGTFGLSFSAGYPQTPSNSQNEDIDAYENSESAIAEPDTLANGDEATIPQPYQPTMLAEILAASAAAAGGGGAKDTAGGDPNSNSSEDPLKDLDKSTIRLIDSWCTSLAAHDYCLVRLHDAKKEGSGEDPRVYHTWARAETRTRIEAEKLEHMIVKKILDKRSSRRLTHLRRRRIIAKHRPHHDFKVSRKLFSRSSTTSPMQSIVSTLQDMAIKSS